MVPSSASHGFFQAFPTVPAQYNSQQIPHAASYTDEDIIVPRILSLYLPDPLPSDVDKSLHSFARKSLETATLRLTVNCETDQPTLHPLNTFGNVNTTTPLRTSEGWRGLKDIQVEAGTVATGYAAAPGHQLPTWNRRIHQFALNHFWSSSSASVTCPAAMTDGAAILLGRHLNDPDVDQPGRAKVIAEARRRLISFDPSEAWTSGQWMTERTGGSDVSQTETVAQRLTEREAIHERELHNSDSDGAGMPLGPWSINGFKWFSSATDADVSVLLARTPKGISAFYAPLRREMKAQPVMNGIRISRLKNKLGTKGLPTAELEIKGMRAWLLGEEGKGIKEISAILNCTRLWTATGAVGGWSRGLAISRAYAKVRNVKGHPLTENKQHMAWMAAETVRYRAHANLAFFGVALLGFAEQGEEAVYNTKAKNLLPKSKAEAEILLRAITPVMKSQCSLAAIAGIRECMESLGGVGYCENNEDGGVMNIARMFRDANVNAIWEGTTNVLAEDLVRALRGKGGQQALESLNALVTRMLRNPKPEFQALSQAAFSKWQGFQRLVGDPDMNEVLYHGRELLQYVQVVLCTGLLTFDALSDNDEIAKAVAQRWGELTLGIADSKKTSGSERAGTDRAIFLGTLGGPRAKM